MRRKLIVTGELGDAPRQLTSPCSDCPWARDAFPGWLGGVEAADWIAAAHAENIAQCHVHPNVECAGLAIFRANVCKVPRTALVLPSDTTHVFASNAEFLEHHTDTGEHRLRAALSRRSR